MVQTSQNRSFVPKRRSAEADAFIIRLHEAENIDQLAKAVFGLIEYLMPYQCISFFFRHLEFELPCRLTPLKYKPVLDDYMKRTHKFDIWLQRSPIHPGLTVVRHGDYTRPISCMNRPSIGRSSSP